MSDFSVRHGRPGRGALHAVGALLKFLVVPLAFIAMITAFASSKGGLIGDRNIQPLIDVLAQLQPMILYLGIALVALAFLKWFYPKGARSRLGFAIGFDVLVAAYVWMLLQDGRTEAAVASFGPDIPLFLLFDLLLVLVAFSVAGELGDYLDNRREWSYRRDQPKGVEPPPLPPLHPEDASQHRFYHDFRPRYGRPGEGFRASGKAVKRFVVYPLALFIISAAVIEYISSTGLGDELGNELGNVKNVLDTTASGILMVGIIITALSFFKGFYPKGSFSRMSFAALAAVATAAWVWIITFGGHIDLEATIGTAPVALQLDYQPLVLLSMFAALLWAAYAVVELISYRKDWVAGGFVPVNDKLIRQRKREEKGRRQLERKVERNTEKAQRKAARSKEQGKKDT
jgi:hypothetical protein